MKYDYIVVGSGIAGLNFARLVAAKGSVLIVTKKQAVESNTNYAQGGIAGVIDPTDTIESHLEDTTVSGDGICDTAAVKAMTTNASKIIYELLELGVPFNKKEKDKIALTKEGGHHAKRIAFVNDYTGRAIEKSLLQSIDTNSNIQILEHSTLIDLLTDETGVFGIKVMNSKENKSKKLLCTGCDLSHWRYESIVLCIN